MGIAALSFAALLRALGVVLNIVDFSSVIAAAPLSKVARPKVGGRSPHSSNDPRPAGLAPRPPPPETYRDEIRRTLLELSPLERTTLRHLHRQQMQTFVGDRDSPVLRSLARRNLLHPMGSSAYRAEAYPYRVPDAVWDELNAASGVVSPTATCLR